MTVKKTYTNFITSLTAIYSRSEAANIAEMIFESVAGITKSQLLIHPEKELLIETYTQINNCLQQLMKHEPVQYVLGEAWFLKMKLKVSPAVLIPRPETEELVSEVISYLQNKTRKVLLDIGTGSGCIAIAIKRNIPLANVSAIDLSSDALHVAKENAELQNTEINFLQIDFLDENTWNQLSVYDTIVSNPPYIPLKEKQLMDKNVTAYEPHTALFVADEKPLIFYEKIALFGITHLHKNGKIFMETHEDLAGEVALLFKKAGYEAIIKKDMFEKERIVMATRCQ